MWLGLYLHAQTLGSPLAVKKKKKNQPEPLDCAASTRLPHSGHCSQAQDLPAHAQCSPTAPSPSGALTLVTLLVTLLTLQTLPPLLGMVVTRIGVLRSPRVTSARGVRGMWGLSQPQPSRLSPAPGDRLRPGCLAAARILPQRWALSSGTGERLWEQPRDGEASPPSPP